MSNTSYLMANLICNNYTHKGCREDDYSQLPRPHYTIAYVLRGRLECIEGGRIVAGNPGDVLFLPYHLRYILRWLGEPETSVYSCHFLFPPLADPFAGKEIPLQRLEGEGEEDFAYIFQNIQNKERTLSVLGRFYNLCDRLYQKLEYTVAPPLDDRIQRAVDYIHANYAHPLSVEQMAAVSNMSPSRFYYSFKKETGMTPIEYKNRASIRQAAMLLVSDRRRSIEEISIETGFASSAYFRRVFKSVTGTTPREYRQKIKT